jgi:hypothetical protein
MSVFPDGLFQYGGQPVGAQWASPWSTVRFVDAATGSTAYDGLKPTQALTLIQAAVTASGRGDVIYVRPQAYVVGTGFSRYTEEVTTVLTQSDLSIIGCVNTINPEYGVRWKHATDTTGYCLVNIAPALHLENIGFYAEGAAGAASLLNNGATNTQRGTDGTTFTNCVVKAGRVIGTGGDGLTFRNCMFHAAPAGGATGGITFTCSTVPGRRLRILDCAFLEGNGAASATEYINIAGVCSEILINNCQFGIIPTSAKYVLITSSTGMISNCSFMKADVHLTNDLTLGGVLGVGNNDVTNAFIA